MQASSAWKPLIHHNLQQWIQSRQAVTSVRTSGAVHEDEVGCVVSHILCMSEGTS
jgi:GR25 family glycosyltransferase involved in LPS biosynthesis